MKKIVFKETGGPEVLSIIDVPDPVIKKNEVLINLKSIGLNWSEIMVRRGEWPMELSGGFTPGVEGVGIVEAVGPDAQKIRPGDKVANFEIDAYLTAGQGNYAGKIAVAEDKVLTLPGDISMTDAAALPMAVLTAYDALINHSPIPESGTILITACTGSVGIAALQIARLKGLRVIATTRSAEKIPAIEEFGAEAILTDDAVDLCQKVSDAAGADGIDYVFDPISGDVASGLISMINPNGTFVSYGLLDGDRFTVDTNLLFNQIKVHGYVVINNLADTKALQKTWNDILPLVREKEIIVPVAKTFPFAEVVQAHKYFENHAHFGKIVLLQ